uniref:Keratin-associated protein 5-4-like n=1 Tax=Haemonchus contortus TaxID=6289 RepID=A0A7I4YZL2_HAECO
MAFSATTALLFSLVGILYLGQLQALPIPGNDAEVALFSTTELASTNTTAIDTLTESESSLRVKRQGGGCGCGCGCGCCCCRPRCCCTCCRTCCCTRCCTCCRPCCCCCGGGGGGCGCGCCGGCGGCGCCGCGGGGRKRRSIQNLKIKLADKIEREQRAALLALPVSFEQSVQPAQPEELVQPAQPETPVQPNQPAQPEQPTQPVVPAQPEDSKDLIEFPFSKPDENIPTEWPQPVFELVTETYA